jgi:hypothetical protein
MQIDSKRSEMSLLPNTETTHNSAGAKTTQRQHKNTRHNNICLVTNEQEIRIIVNRTNYSLNSLAVNRVNTFYDSVNNLYTVIVLSCDKKLHTSQ